MARFLVVGGTNTLVTTAAFYALALVLSAGVAYTIVYVAGLAFVVAVTPGYVFGSRASASRRLVLALWYVAVYAIGIGVIALIQSEVSARRLVVVLGTSALTAPLSFLGARLVVRRPASVPRP
jgi:putative flippase GtrA